MRVALYTDSNVFAGTERHILELARGLAGEGIEVSIACPADSPLVGAAAGVSARHIAIAKRGLFDFPAMLKLRALLVSGGLDAVHAHNGRTALAAASAVALAGRGAAVATQHFIDPAHAGRGGVSGRLSHAAHRWVQRKTKGYVAISKAVRDAMTSREPGVAEKITVIPNGIGAPDHAALRAREEVRKEFGVAADAPLIVCAARLEPEKDIPTLIHAMDAVVAEFPNARCVIAGEGRDKAALEGLLLSTACAGNVTLAGFRKDALSVINAADLFVLPSVAEPFGLVLLEAMALGKPVIATAAGGPVEIVADGGTGTLVTPRDPAAMARAILVYLRDPELRASAGAAGLRRYEHHFTARAMAEATAALYRRALSDERAVIFQEKPCESC
jgi:glycosyltransferase involved in cell wall biosynthesis